MILWKINGTALATLGLRMVAGNMRTHGPSSMQLDRDAAFDAAEPSGLQYGDAVVLTWEDTDDEEPTPVPYFQGTVISVPKYGNVSDEGQTIVVEDAWGQLERTIFQDTWNYGDTSQAIPKTIFGVNASGDPVTVGAMIGLVIDYAESVGIDIEAGTLPTGEIPIPIELNNVFCSEVILTALKLHPDWMPWIDHTTTPPQFNVTPIASAEAVEISVGGTTDEVPNFSVTKRDDLLPASVRIFYDFATQADVGGEPQIQRNGVIDKWPTDGPDSGPRVLSAIIPLQGMQMQVQKSRVQTRTIPTGPTAEGVKEYIQKKWLHLRDVDPTHFEVLGFEAFLQPEDEAEPHPDPISPRATRIVPESVTELPRELVRGSVEDWMRKKSGRVVIQIGIGAAEGATEAELAEIAKDTPAISIVATNATTRLYKGITQWVAAESVPTDIAQSVYESIRAASQWQGSCSVQADEIPTARYVGKKLNLTEGLSAWATMAAPIHSMDWDVDKGTAKITYGPNPALAPTDFLEMQRILRSRMPTWMSGEERISNQIGAEGSASAAGDTVAGYEHPQTEMAASAGGAEPSGAPWQVYKTGATAADIALGRLFLEVVDYTAVSITAPDPFTLAATTKIWIEVDSSSYWSSGTISATIESGTSWPDGITFSGTTPYASTASIVRIGQVNSGELPQGRDGFDLTISDVAYHFEQLLQDHLCIQVHTVDGKSAALGTPFGG